jgi:3D (Asp-Asp-Asp) domain-containing protein
MQNSNQTPPRLRRGLHGIFGGRMLWVCLLMISLSGIVLYVTDNVKTVLIRDGEEVSVMHTFQEEPSRILSQKQIATMAFDMVDASDLQGKLGVIEIKRAFPVMLEVDGEIREIMTTETRVDDFLSANKVALGEYDSINVAPGLYLSPNEQISIQRIEFVTETETQEIPYDTIFKENSLLKAGKTRVLKPGQPGEMTKTYMVRIVDGEKQEPMLIGEIITKEPVSELVLRGAAKPVSSLDFGIELDESGVPVEYTKLLTNQISTGYSAGEGAYGASMMNLFAGYVAVRADEIPYGTRMYITSADNKFVYGFAIAADTGIALMDNVIDFDLFYETYVESCLNGRKYLNVYILD